jgi:hypothetical protein
MNTKNMWIAVLSGAALSLLVSNLPFLGFVNCLLCGAFWGSAIFAVWLYRHLSGTLTVREGVKIGAISGLLAGLIGFGLSFLGLAGAQGFMNSAQQLLPPDAAPELNDLPAWGAWVFNFVGVLLNVGFGAIGGWIGGAIFNPNRKSGKKEDRDEKEV